MTPIRQPADDPVLQNRLSARRKNRQNALQHYRKAYVDHGAAADPEQQPV
jgi:hypothetical protein